MGRAVRVFLSYRRGDVGGYAGRLSDDLRERLGTNSVFQDVTAIELGAAFTVAIDRALDESDAVLAVIGPRWLSAATPQGTRRLFEADDSVRLELTRALQREVRVVPVLVGGADLPAADALPEDLRGLVERQGIALRDESWRQDVESLVGSLRGEPVMPNRRPHRWLIATAAAVLLALAGVGIGLWVTSGGNSGQGSRPTLTISPDHGRISTAIVVSGTGCPRGRQIDIIFDSKAVTYATCQADDTFRTSFSPDTTGVLPWTDDMGHSHTMTVSAGTTYTLYAQTPNGDWVSPSVTYPVVSSGS